MPFARNRPGKLRNSGRVPLRQQVSTITKILATMSADGKAPPMPASLQHLAEVREVRAKRAPTTANGLLEADVLEDSLAALRSHESVCFAWRLQSGLFKDGERHVRVGFKGMPDIVGMLWDGRLFAVEVKREIGGVTSPEQKETLQRIRNGCGLAGVAHSAAEAVAIIEG